MTNTPNIPAVRAGRWIPKALWTGALVLATVSFAGPAAPGGVARAAVNAQAYLLSQAAPSISADQAAALVRQSTGGRILDVRRVDAAGGPAYRVKVLLDGGRVRVFLVDAGSGAILR